MSRNDWLVIGCDVTNKVALAVLGANVAGVQLPPYLALALLCLSVAAGTALTHLEPVGSRRASP